MLKRIQRWSLPNSNSSAARRGRGASPRCVMYWWNGICVYASADVLMHTYMCNVICAAECVYIHIIHMYIMITAYKEMIKALQDLDGKPCSTTQRTSLIMAGVVYNSDKKGRQKFTIDCTNTSYKDKCTTATILVVVQLYDHATAYYFSILQIHISYKIYNHVLYITTTFCRYIYHISVHAPCRNFPLWSLRTLCRILNIS